MFSRVSNRLRESPYAISLRAKRLFSSYIDNNEDEDDDSNIDRDDQDKLLRPRKALVLGSSGALGSYVARHFSKELQMQVMGADILERSPGGTSELDGLDAFCLIPNNHDASLPEATTSLTEAVHDFCMSDGVFLDCIVVASGGFVPDPVAPKPVGVGVPLPREQYLQSAHDYSSTANTLIQRNLYPVIASSFLAQHFMNPKSSLLVMIGATAALHPTPSTIGYGTSKAAAHHCLQSIGAATGKGQESRANAQVGRRVRQHLPSLDNLSAIGLLPLALDTPANRDSMPDADTSSWTSIPALTEEISRFLTTPQLRPHSGSLIKVFNNKDGSGSAYLELIR